MDDDRSGRDVDGAIGGAHHAAALAAEIDLGCVGMTMKGARLSGFPTREADIAAGDRGKDPLQAPLRVELLLCGGVEHMHALVSSQSTVAWRSSAPAMGIRARSCTGR